MAPRAGRVHAGARGAPARVHAHVRRDARHDDELERSRIATTGSATASARPRLDDDPLWYKDAIIYEVRTRSFYDSNGDGIGDLQGLAHEARLPRRPRRHGALAPPLLPFARARRRLRHRRLHRRPPRHRHARGLRRAPRGGASARTPRHHRAGPQPHLGPASVVPAGAPRAAGLARARLLRLERHRRPLPGSAHHLPRLRALELVLGSGREGRISGTASSRTSPTSTSTTPPCTRRCSASSTSGWRAASTGCGSTRCPTSTRRRAPTARTSPRRTRS